MRIEIDAEYAARLTRLTEAVEMSRALWVRGAIRAAEADPDLARQIADSAPESEHGGARPGAGRPKRPGAPDARSIPEQGVRRHDTTI